MFPQTAFENELARELQHDRLAALGRPQVEEWLRGERSRQGRLRRVLAHSHHPRRPV